jgi:hypothetical protein
LKPAPLFLPLCFFIFWFWFGGFFGLVVFIGAGMVIASMRSPQPEAPSQWVIVLPSKNETLCSVKVLWDKGFYVSSSIESTIINKSG